MVGLEVDMIVKDSLKALELYERIFEVERIEVTNLPQGQNEAVFMIYGNRFHLLDENPELHMFAPAPDHPLSIWFTVVIPDTQKLYDKALTVGCTTIQPVTEMPEMGIKNAMVADPFGYTWMMLQIQQEVSFEDRCRIMEEQLN